MTLESALDSAPSSWPGSVEPRRRRRRRRRTAAATGRRHRQWTTTARALLGIALLSQENPRFQRDQGKRRRPPSDRRLRRTGWRRRLVHELHVEGRGGDDLAVD